MTDWFTEELFDLPEATRIVFPMSRLVVDPERFLDDAQEVMAEMGMGVIYTHTSQGEPLRLAPSAKERSELLDRHYHPHHQRLSEAVDCAVKAFGYCLVVDGHSFPSAPLPYESDQSSDRPDICLGTDSFHTPAWLIDVAAAAFHDLGLTVAVDRPFAGALVPLSHFQRNSRVLALMVEVNRGLYIDECTGRRTVNFLALKCKVQDTLTAIMAACRPIKPSVRATPTHDRTRRQAPPPESACDQSPNKSQCMFIKLFNFSLINARTDENPMTNNEPTFHPRLDSEGKQHRLKAPSQPSPLSNWELPSSIATTIPDGPRPSILNGLPFEPWLGSPSSRTEWASVPGQGTFSEPPFPQTSMEHAAGVVILEADGRIWTVSPSNRFAGYRNTFPKGRSEPGLNYRATAIKEAFEESGLQVALTAWLVDVSRSTTLTRYYLARRVGGDPTTMGWESQAVHLVPLAQLSTHASHANDLKILAALADHFAKIV
jgi:N-formylglutamate amidohydrolase/ADP-ribose pyrophosphatase YjhB (NUDIX family)